MPNPTAPTSNSFVKKGISVMMSATPTASRNETSSIVRSVIRPLRIHKTVSFG